MPSRTERHYRVLMMTALVAAAIPQPASALPSSYAREHPADCAEAWAKKTNARGICASAEFCAQHGNVDRFSRIACDPYISKADRKLETVTLSHAWLKTAGDIAEVDTLYPCHAPYQSPADRGLPEDKGGMLPAQMKTAKLGLCAAIWVGWFPTSIVKAGIDANGTGMMEVTWNRNSNGPRETHSVKLSLAETTRLLIAINRSDFWRLAHGPSHYGVTDGEGAVVEAAIAGHRNRVTDMIGDSDAVDVSILVNALSEIIAKHWHDVPGA